MKHLRIAEKRYRLHALIAAIALVGCTRQSDITACSELSTCAGGRAYQFCATSTVSGCGVGYYQLSDGTQLDCANCNDCQGAAVRVGGWCAGSSLMTMDMGTTGQAPVDLLAPSVMVDIPKSGATYSGPHFDPMLYTIADCPDAQPPSSLEPDDGPTQAVRFDPTPDTPTAKIVQQAICPTGPNPFTGRHDNDWFAIDTRNGPSSLWLMAQLFYDIEYGDLDVAIYDSQLNRLSFDGSAVTNACTATPIGNGVYFVVVVGANNLDVNRYQLLIQTFTQSTACP